MNFLVLTRADGTPLVIAKDAIAYVSAPLQYQDAKYAAHVYFKHGGQIGVVETVAEIVDALDDEA